MMCAGWMRRYARRTATRRIFCIDQPMRSGVPASSAMVFLGRCLVRAVADGCQHGKRQHDQRDVTMPAVLRTGFVVIKAQFGLGGLETILNGPTLAFI